MTQLERFCKTHHACTESRDWAVNSGYKTTAMAWLNCHRGDWMIWMLRAQGKLDKRGWARIAVEMAADVLDIYERRYPDNIEPRRAIDRARAWVADPTEENLELCRQSAAAASAAFSAAAAAAYADAADAAAAAYAAADAAYAYARTKALRAMADMVREVIPWEAVRVTLEGTD